MVVEREADPVVPHDNARVEIPREVDQAVEWARRMFSGRDGRLLLTLVLAVTAAIEATLYTPDNPELLFESGGGDPTAAVLLNVFAVVPLLATDRFPVLAAGAASFFSFVILVSPETAITLSALGVMLYLVGNMVVQRGRRSAAPILLVFLANALVPFDGGRVDIGSIGPFLLLVGAVLVGESRRKEAEAVTALDETQAAMAESVREQTALEER